MKEEQKQFSNQIKVPFNEKSKEEKSLLDEINQILKETGGNIKKDKKGKYKFNKQDKELREEASENIGYLIDAYDSNEARMLSIKMLTEAVLFNVPVSGTPPEQCAIHASDEADELMNVIAAQVACNIRENVVDNRGSFIFKEDEKLFKELRETKALLKDTVEKVEDDYKALILTQYNDLNMH